MSKQSYATSFVASFFLCLCLFFLGNLEAQNTSSKPLYIEVTKLKQTGDDLRSVEAQIVKPYVQERIKRGNQLSHAFFKVRYPYSDNAEYDYVEIDVFANFNDLHLGEEQGMHIASTIFSEKDLPTIYKRYKDASKVASSEVFLIRDMAVPNLPSKISSFVQVNHMDVSEQNAAAYAQLEMEIFKPIHASRCQAGTMNRWVLAERILPYGSQGDNDFMTFDFYDSWGNISNGDMDGIFTKVHPDKKSEDVWAKLSAVRSMPIVETWELISHIDKPAEMITYTVIKAGTGASPMTGQEVEWKGKVMDKAGKVLMSTEYLGFSFYSVLGSDPYDQFWDKGLKQLKKGGVLQMLVPYDAQDEGTRNLSKGESVTMEVEMLSFGEVGLDGAALLKKTIKAEGLAAAKSLYAKLQSSNPEGYVFREDKMNTLGYQLSGEGEHDASIFVFEQNTKMYPKSWNACDSLADGFLAAGKVSKAKHCLEMALKLKPDFAASKDKLDKL